MTPERFFETAIPQMASDRMDAFMSSAGTLSVSVGGSAWTIRLGDTVSPVEKGRSQNADVEVAFSAEAFVQWLDGKLDAKAAVAAGDVGAQGNIDLLDALGRILQMPVPAGHAQMAHMLND